MVTINQVKDGLVLYIDKEIVEKVSGLAKWGLAFASAAIVSNLNMDKYVEMGKSLGYVTKDSMVDIDKLYADFIKIVRSKGSVTQHFPMIGDVTFSENDVDLLKRYINGN